MLIWRNKIIVQVSYFLKKHILILLMTNALLFWRKEISMKALSPSFLISWISEIMLLSTISFILKASVSELVEYKQIEQHLPVR